MSLIAPIKIEYKNYTPSLRPNIGIYYIFENFKDKGICKEYKIDLKEIFKKQPPKIYPVLNYVFKSEKRLLETLERNKIQAIKTEIPEGIAPKQCLDVLAHTHFADFIKRYDWIKKIKY